MEFILKIVELLFLSIKIILNNPLLLILFVITVIINSYYPKFRGFMGEFWVKAELNKLNKKEYIVLNNIMIEDELGSHQIDHIVISKYGIFVIEMKNYFGMITGNETQDKWIQHLGRKKYYFKNPIHQNYGHIKSLETLLNIDSKYFISIICFSNQAKLKVKTKNIVVQLDYLNKEIKSFNNMQIKDDVNILKNKLILSNITDIKKRKKHINNIKAKIKENKQKEKNMICPRCGGRLILKNGKYGSFFGCNNFPKCKYIKK